MTSIGPSILIGIIITFIINKYIISYSQVKQQEISFIFALKCTLLLIPVILLISTLATTTQAQIAIWKNSITLWSQEIQTLEKPPILSYYHRGIAYTQSGSYELSIQDFNSALAINPTEKRIYQLRGISYALSGDAINALSDFKRALEIDANYAIAYYSIGNVYSEQGKLELALANYEKALSLGLNEAEEKITEIKNKRATR
jgi:tetratricopeptide (TPR) repeat protein